MGKQAIIGIDGWTGVGKSTLASALANQLNASTYDLDTALIRDRQHYVAALKIDEIATALTGRSGLLLVSGICLRQVLEMTGHAADAHIYIKRMATWGWADEDELSGPMAGISGSLGGDNTRQEMRDYHVRYQPHLNADFEFRWAG